jgi:hypothetical protein
LDPVAGLPADVGHLLQLPVDNPELLVSWTYKSGLWSAADLDWSAGRPPAWAPRHQRDWAGPALSDLYKPLNRFQPHRANSSFAGIIGIAVTPAG